MRDSADRCSRPGVPVLLLIAAFGTLLTGCAGGKAAVYADPYARPEAALHALALSAPGGTITATARIVITTRGERYPLKAAVMMRKPADLRLESIPILGPPDFFLSIAEGELRVFIPAKGAFYTGPAVSSTISRFFPLALPAAEIVSILMGRPPEEEVAWSAFGGELEDGLYRVDRYRDGRKRSSLWIDPAGGLLARTRIFAEGDEVSYTADFTEYTRMGTGFMPQRVTVSSEAVSLALHYTELRMLEGNAESFALPPPAGITPIPLLER